MHFQPVDHPPLIVGEPWGDTWERWYQEGYPRGVNLNDYFEIEPFDYEYGGLQTGLFPMWEEKIITETENEVIKIDQYGRKVKDFKGHTSMPEWLEFPVKTPEDLRRVINERLDPVSLDARWPVDWEEKKVEVKKEKFA